MKNGNQNKNQNPTNQKDEALVHYEMEFGKNETIKKQARILYYASQGAGTITELCEKTGNCYRTVNTLIISLSYMKFNKSVVNVKFLSQTSI